jgi:hypothetical protein
MRPPILLILLLLASSYKAESQIDDHQLGSWYIYSWQVGLQESAFSLQGTIQDRNLRLTGDMRQLLLQAGLTYQPTNSRFQFTAGYYFLGSGDFGNERAIIGQHIIYEDASWRRAYLQRLNVTHRFRFEQRFVENQNFRTRFRYKLSMKIPLNKTSIGTGAIYVAFADELFINGQRYIGHATTVALFDRNRFDVALGYCLNHKLKIQIGPMWQTTHLLNQHQLQLVLSHKF